MVNYIIQDSKIHGRRRNFRTNNLEIRVQEKLADLSRGPLKPFQPVGKQTKLYEFSMYKSDKEYASILQSTMRNFVYLISLQVQWIRDIKIIVAACLGSEDFLI